MASPLTVDQPTIWPESLTPMASLSRTITADRRACPRGSSLRLRPEMPEQWGWQLATPAFRALSIRSPGRWH